MCLQVFYSQCGGRTLYHYTVTAVERHGGTAVAVGGYVWLPPFATMIVGDLGQTCGGFPRRTQTRPNGNKKMRHAKYDGCIGTAGMGCIHRMHRGECMVHMHRPIM